MAAIGYAFLKSSLKLTSFDVARPARISPVTRITQTDDALLVPSHVAPDIDAPIAHAIFALKHEGVCLQTLMQALRHVSDPDMIDAVKKAPSGSYIRLLGFLWEKANQRHLDPLPDISGPTIKLFDERRYITTQGIRDARWRVNFNGIGTLDYCATVERTPVINALLAEDTLTRANQFMAEQGTDFMDQALSWAFLHETESSFAIEKETATRNKSEVFANLLAQADQPRLMDEAYLVSLQNAAISNPLDKAVGYRHQQNWLRGPARGALGITYLPPAPTLTASLMSELNALINGKSQGLPPLVTAAVASFGFVFLHPFMDGNGRLSRFLFHYVLAQSGRLNKGLLLPVSVAMKRHERDYLSALQAYSAPARACWDVTWIGDEDYDFKFKADDTIYRYWNATTAVAFCLQMAKEALERDLKEETQFLMQFDRVYKTVDAAEDIRGNDLTILVRSALQNECKISTNRRKQFQATVTEAAFDLIEAACREERSS
jgi:Fic/DOC family